MKTVYKYDHDTHEYLGETYAQLDRVMTEKLHGHPVYAMPPDTTDVVPAKPLDGYAQVFDERQTVWSYIRDRRGTQVVNTETKKIGTYDRLGDIVFPYTEDIPDSRLLPYLKYEDGQWVLGDRQKLVDDIWDIRKSVRDQACSDILEYDGHQYRVDSRSLTDITLAAQEFLMTRDETATRRWVTYDSQNVTLTGRDFINILLAYGDRRQRLVYESNDAWQRDVASTDEELLETYKALIGREE